MQDYTRAKSFNDALEDPEGKQIIDDQKFSDDHLYSILVDAIKNDYYNVIRYILYNKPLRSDIYMKVLLNSINNVDIILLFIEFCTDVNLHLPVKDDIIKTISISGPISSPVHISENHLKIITDKTLHSGYIDLFKYITEIPDINYLSLIKSAVKHKSEEGIDIIIRKLGYNSMLVIFLEITDVDLLSRVLHRYKDYPFFEDNITALFGNAVFRGYVSVIEYVLSLHVFSYRHLWGTYIRDGINPVESTRVIQTYLDNVILDALTSENHPVIRSICSTFNSDIYHIALQNQKWADMVFRYLQAELITDTFLDAVKKGYVDVVRVILDSMDLSDDFSIIAVEVAIDNKQGEVLFILLSEYPFLNTFALVHIRDVGYENRLDMVNDILDHYQNGGEIWSNMDIEDFILATLESNQAYEVLRIVLSKMVFINSEQQDDFKSTLITIADGLQLPNIINNLIDLYCRPYVLLDVSASKRDYKL